MREVCWKWTGSAGEEGVMFECPGCRQHHAVRTSGGGSCWGWNGSLTAPTFTPSILVRWVDYEAPPLCVCHSFVRDGQIQFLGDCTHGLAGKTVPLPEIER